jgi:dCMP deaminase
VGRFLESKKMRPTRIQIWVELAQRFAQRSTCSRLQVGAIITSKDMERVYSVGYNGGARKQKNDCESLDPGMCGHLHAEINALIKCQINDPHKILFITHMPCSVCAKAIVNSRFSAIYYINPYRSDAAKVILETAGIKVIKI